MRILLIACSKKAYILAQKFIDKSRKVRPENQILCRVKCSSLPDISMKETLQECMEEWFPKVDAIVFFCAAGIAVRSIAPFIRHKSVDPAVIVVDEAGTYSISLLSGHYGGGNRLAEDIADILGAVPVITTATDREGRFAVDDFARRNHLEITDWKLAKEISAAILEGERVCFHSELPVEGVLPEELIPGDAAGNEGNHLEILISNKKFSDSFRGRTLQLIPRNIYLGIGCRKNISEDGIETAVKECFAKAGIDPWALVCAASIDLKRDEPGLLAFCEKRGIPLRTFTREELAGVLGSKNGSAFVEQVTGVDNVCERSALAAGGERLILEKQVREGVTTAIAESREKVVI